MILNFNRPFLSLIFLAFYAFSFQSCEIAGEVILNADDLTVQLEENKPEGAIVGQIKATADGAALDFEVMSSVPSEAFEIDRTGILTIANSVLFDFEVRDQLTAEVKVSADDQSEIVNILVELEDALAPIEEWNQLTKAWNIMAYTINGEAIPCREDDQLTISGTGNYVFAQGNVVCENETQLWKATGTWDLDENLNFILFDKGTATEFKMDLPVFEPGKMTISTDMAGDLISIEMLTN